MMSYEGHGSEVASLLSRITAEYEAAQRGLTGLAYGLHNTSLLAHAWKLWANCIASCKLL